MLLKVNVCDCVYEYTHTESVMLWLYMLDVTMPNKQRGWYHVDDMILSCLETYICILDNGWFSHGLFVSGKI